LQKPESPDFEELAVRLGGCAARIFAEFGLGGPRATVAGVGLSIEDFVWRVLAEYAEGKLEYEDSRGKLFSLLATVLRNDIIDALRKAAHAREEGQTQVSRAGDSETGSSRLGEFPSSAAEIYISLEEDQYRERVRAAFADEPELGEVVKAVLDLDLSKPQEIAEALGISTLEYQNRKKRLRRRLVEYNLAKGNRKGARNQETPL
jgi:DNA-directed RNA polymerase specialized sigma24 family protein